MKYEHWTAHRSITAPPVDERTERPSQFFWKILFTDRAKHGDSRLVCLQLGDAAAAARKVLFERGVFVGWQLTFNEVGQQPHDVGAVPH